MKIHIRRVGNMFFCIFLNPSFFSAYFYAQSENYKISLVDKNKKLIKFHKIKIIDNGYNS